MFCLYGAGEAGGLGYEIVWTRELSLALGTEMMAVLGAVAGFFGGLALGAFDRNGNLLWTALDDFPGPTNVLSMPYVGSDGVIYDGQNLFNLYAVNPDGSVRWHADTDAADSSSPALSASSRRSSVPVHTSRCAAAIRSFHRMFMRPAPPRTARRARGGCLSGG